MDYSGFQRLALAVIKDAFHQWKKNKSEEAKEFLEGDMWPFIDASGMELDDMRLCRMLRANGLVPKAGRPDLNKLFKIFLAMMI